MGINTGLKRMDSMLVASNIKKLSRLELIYTCVASLVKLLHKNKEDIPEVMQYYFEEDYGNKVIYHMKTTEFIELAKIRNGVESLPSALRRKYHVDKMQFVVN